MNKYASENNSNEKKNIYIDKNEMEIYCYDVGNVVNRSFKIHNDAQIFME